MSKRPEKDNALNSERSMDDERDRATTDAKAGQDSHNPETEEDTASGGAPEQPDT